MANPYTITIKLPSSTDESAMAGSSTKKSNSPSESQQNANSVADAAQKVVTYAAVMHTAEKLVSYEISQVNLKTGASEYQQRLESSYSALKQFAMPIVGAAVTGNIPFAFVASIWAGVNGLISIAQKTDELNTRRDLENMSIGMQIVRAGTNNSRSGNQ